VIISALPMPARRSTLVTWLVLTGCTVLSWSESSSGRPSIPVILVMLSLTAIKSALIIASYMEISRAPRWLQMLGGTWVVVVFGMLGYILCVAA